ncbi:MAG: hypothetical protein P1P64_02940 [Treponemataceae bacterium]
MFKKLKNVGFLIWAVIASMFAILGYVLLKRKDKKSIDNIEKEAQNAKEKTKQEIENTPAGELVSNATNAGELHKERESITERFRAEVRNRLEQKLHGTGSADFD